ncbi:MAG: L-histidine N(alpha)-methyltransferase [Pirellulaceae bacterium]|nr:L-histidine N(alpha)-methyltransferase [Pirellulaceae bacterium]
MNPPHRSSATPTTLPTSRINSEPQLPVSQISVSQTSDIHTSDFLMDVIKGMSSVPRSLAAKYFYDETGSKLFDQICELPEYYPTRTESQIMARYATSMADCIGPNCRLIEYGSGSSIKTRILLDHLVDPAVYVPVDISDEHLRATAENLSPEYPLLPIAPVSADFTAPFDLPRAGVGVDRTCIYFPGSTIGNFSPRDAQRLLAGMPSCGRADGLLIGFDLQKDVAVLEAAYNDQRGVTAAFNKNLLARINRELYADFDLSRFHHLAFYNSNQSRIEMHLRSRCAQEVHIAGQSFQLQRAETIRTEYSHKYTIEGFSAMAARAGWASRRTWTDEQNYFAVMYLERSNWREQCSSIK